MPTTQRTDDLREGEHPPGIGRLGTRLLELAENVIYAGISTFLVGTALICLALAGKTSWGLLSDFSEQPVLDLLDILLLVFIVVELLFAVRSTVQKRELLAEPFLLVGIIASIKEIVVLSVESAKEVGNGAEFDDRITEIAVLGVLVLLLGATSWLLRRKEREPDEGENSPPAPERQVD
ncbi:MAG TPA: phosphate-starvation-inducible PsiE family protein [Blastococcus sp.]